MNKHSCKGKNRELQGMTGSMQDGNPTGQTVKLGAKCLLSGECGDSYYSPDIFNTSAVTHVAVSWVYAAFFSGCPMFLVFTTFWSLLQIRLHLQSFKHNSKMPDLTRLSLESW